LQPDQKNKRSEEQKEYNCYPMILFWSTYTRNSCKGLKYCFNIIEDTSSMSMSTIYGHQIKKNASIPGKVLERRRKNMNEN
jgi:hypothetical protein